MGRNIKKVLKVRKYKAGYEVREEEVFTNFEGLHEGPTFTMKSAYTPEGDYIGNSVWAYRLCKKRGIKPELANPNDNVCAIGFCEERQKWAGWSHRCLCEFGIGNRLFEEDYGDDYTLYIEHGDIVIENLDQAKQAAINFADYVG